MAVLARFTGMFLSLRFMSLCKSVFYTRTGRTTRVCVERARVSVTRHRVCLCAACLRVFVG